MARQLRIEYPGAYYHVYSRGNQKQVIFLAPEDRYFLLKIVRDAHEKFDVLIHAYCLMNNHYHFMLQTLLANLSRVMHFINTAYSAYLNAKHGRCGHLFQGRYKSILVDAEAYALVLSRYIHLNPVKNGMVEDPEQYVWSSCQEYFGLRKPPAWLDIRVILGSFGGPLDIAHSRYADYLRSDLNAPPGPEFAEASRLGIMGSSEFVEKMKNAFLKSKVINPDREFPQLRRLKNRPELSRIQEAVAGRFGSKNRLVRKATIYIAHKNTDYKLKEIGEFLKIGPTAVSLAFRKMEREISPGSPLAHAIREIEDELFRETTPI